MDFMLFIVILMSLVVYADGCRFGSGSNCAFPCNCNNDGCDQETGDCTDNGGCKSLSPTGWGGPGCLIGNIAHSKSISQSSTSGSHTAQYGNDGYIGEDCLPNRYTHTNEDNPAWLKINLGSLYRIENVTVYDRPDASTTWDRIQGTKIQILDGDNVQDCGTIPETFYKNNDDKVMTFTCNTLKGDSVRLYKDQDTHLHICELVVMGYLYTEQTSKCQTWMNDIVGCGTCQQGKRLPDCIEDCPSEYYGVNCKDPCSTNCNSGSSPICDPVSGRCRNGCRRWYVGEWCDTEIYKLEIHNTDVSATTTSSSFTVTWKTHLPPPSGQERFYHFFIRYRLDNGNFNQSEEIPMANNGVLQSYTLPNLLHNTVYWYSLRCWRTVRDDVAEYYDSSDMKIQTKCKAPSLPPDITLTVVGDNYRIGWTTDSLSSGCDSMTVTVQYKFSENGEWKNEDMSNGRTEYFILAGDNTQCWARIKMINNEALSSASSTMMASIIKKPGDTSAKPENTNPGEVNTSPNPGNRDPGAIKSTKDPPSVSMIAGVAVAAVVVVVLVVIIVLLFTRYRRSLPVFGKKKDKESKQKLSIDVKFETGKSVTPMGDVPIMPGPAPASSPKPKPISPRPQPAAKPVVQVNTSIPVSQLGSYIAKKRKERDGFKNEYATLPEDETAPCERGSLPENKTKNRFLNIRAYDHSRVILETENDDPFSDYINCNYIPGFDGNKEHYIAGQGPKPHNIVDLWRMIWQKKINRIAMMTNEIENSRRKCDRYWPENVEGSQQYGAITVTTMGIERFPFYTIRLLRVQKDGVSRSVRQFHFTAWIDKRIPEYAFPLLGFRKKVRMYDKQSTGPLFVHCSAGVGRTGTFIAIDYLLEQAKHKHTIDIRKWVNTMRGCRINMIQTLEQYIFVYDTLQEALACGDTSIPASELETTLKQLKVKQKGEKISPLEAQYKVIDDFRPVPKGEDFKALSEDNIHKNRDPNIYPSDLARPYLLTKSENGNDYINAVFVHGYNRSNHYIITQMPLPTTAVDFWRMVCDIDIVTIVALNEINDEDCTPYWPDENDSTETYGPIEVAFKSSQDDEIASVSTFEITNNENGGRKKEVEHIRMMNWPDNTLPDPKNLIHIVNLLEQRAQLHNEGNVVIHCLKGVSNSGILVAALNMIEKLKIDQEIDVFTAVKAIRINRNMFIESFEQYEYLYQVAQTYKAMNDTYANFS